MITDELRSTWSSPVGPFTVESNSAPGAAWRMKSWALGPHLSPTSGLTWAPSGLGALQALEKPGWSPQVSGSCNLLVRIVYQHLLCFNSFSSHRDVVFGWSSKLRRGLETH